MGLISTLRHTNQISNKIGKFDNIISDLNVYMYIQYIMAICIGCEFELLVL